MDGFITEDGLLHPEVLSILKAIFSSCNEDNQGTVEVSKFMQFLTEKATSSEVFEYLHVLNEILDPRNVNCSIDWPLCQRGIQKWIHFMNNKNFSQNVDSTSTPLRSLSVSTPRNLRQAVGVKNFNARTYSNHSVEETSQGSLDLSLLTSRVEELETNNTHLLIENQKLKENLNITEDINGSMLLENEELRFKGEKQEKELDSMKTELETLYEVKTSLVEYQSLYGDMREKESALLRENKLLTDQVANYKTKICQMDSSFELLKAENKKLSEELVNETNANSKIEYMSLMVKELTVSNEVLRAQKVNIERELSEMRQDYNGFTIKGNANSSFNQSFNGNSSTQPSLFEELTAELHSSVNNDTLAHETSDVGIERDCLVLVKEFCQMFSGKREMMLGEIKNLGAQQPEESKEKLCAMVGEWSTEFETFMKSFTKYAQGKHLVEGKLFDLSDALKVSEEEKRQMNESMDKAIVKLSSLSVSSLEKQNRMQKLEEELECVKGELEETRNENKKIYEEVSILSKTSSELEEQEGQQVADLKKLVEGLESRNIEISRQIFDLEEQLALKVDELAKEKENVHEKENMLLSMKMKHETGLLTLLKIIPFSDSYQDLTLSITIDNVINTLVLFLDKCEHEKNVSKGMRDSPDGFDHVDTMSYQVKYSDEKYTANVSLPDKIVDEELPPKAINNETPSKQRRYGVSAEPVTVKWTSFEKYLEPMKLECEKEDIHPVMNQDNISHIDNTTSYEEKTAAEVEEKCECSDSENGDGNILMVESNVMSLGTVSTPKDNFPVYENTDSNDKYSELEDEYRTFLRAFQAGQYTLPQRLEKQQRARDLSESVFEKELQVFTSGLTELEESQFTPPHSGEKFLLLHKQIDVLRKAMSKVSQQSEQHGCYQQEHHVSPSIEMTIRYVESLRNDVHRMEDELAMVKDNNKFDCLSCNSCNNDSSSLSASTNVLENLSFQDPLEKEETDSSCETSAEAVTDLQNSVATVAKVAEHFINTRNRRRGTKFFPDRGKKCVTFNSIDTETFYSPGEPISTTPDTFGISLTLCKKLCKVFLFLCFVGVFSVILYSGFEVKPRKLHDVLTRYFPVRVERSNPYVKT